MLPANDLRLRERTMSASDPPADPPLKPLGEYHWPDMPAERTVLSIAERIKSWFIREDDTPIVNKSQLKRTAGQSRDEAPSAPSCEPLLRDIAAHLNDWANKADEASSRFVLVLPPNQHQAVLCDWAEQHNYPLLPSPDRSRLLTESHQPFSLDGEGILVIPELSHWFLRHQHGLRQVSRLLAALSETKRPCIIGCNSWAWAYLCRAVNASHWLPQAHTFQAFDQHRLHGWLLSLDQDAESAPVRYRESKTGDDIFETDSDGELQSDYLETLAALSFGIPWVAWTLWQHSLRTVPEEEEEEASDTRAKEADPNNTFWLVDHRERVITEDIRENALFILHAILLHGELSREQLDKVLPSSRTHATLAAVISQLIDQGFIVEQDACLRCTNLAYPDIRRYLNESGFPVDIL